MPGSNIQFVYFGGEPLGVPVLEKLKAAKLLPSLIVCNPDRPVGRKQVLTPPPVKEWAETEGIPVWQPESLKAETDTSPVTAETWDLFVVVAYNRILPKWLIELPAHGTLNMHPSLLPHFRGASPIRSAILTDARQTGVTVMQMDEQMDHGPILAQEAVEIPETDWPMAGPELDALLAQKGGELLAQTIPAWVAGKITPQEQDHEAATYCGKITKDMAELELDPYNLPSGPAAYKIFLKIQAFAGAPTAFFQHDGKRFKITAAHLAPGGQLVIEKVVPEGKSGVDFSAYFT